MPTNDTPSHAHDDALDEEDDPVEGKTLDELRAELDAIDIDDTSRADKWVGREEDLILITPADSAPKDDDTPTKRAAAKAPIPLNNTRLTDTAWRRLPLALRTALRHTLSGKRAIIGHQVLAVAKVLCGRGAYGLTFDFNQALEGPGRSGPYEGCGLGLLMHLRELMGEDAAAVGETIILQRGD